MKPKVKKGGLKYLSVIAYRNIYRNIRRSILCFIAIALAVFFIIFAMGFIEGMLESMYKVIQLFETGDIVVYTKEYEPKKEFFPLQYPIEPDGDINELITSLESIEGVKAVLPRIISGATLMDNTVKHAVLWGVDVEKENATNHLNLKDRTNGLLAGRYPHGNKSECAIGFRLAKKLGVLGRLYSTHDFNWLIENIDSESDKSIIKNAYKFNPKTKMYVFRNSVIKESLFRKFLNWILQKEKQYSMDKETYVELFNVIIDIERTTIPETISLAGDGGLLDKINLTYQKEYVLEHYNVNKEGSEMVINSNLSAEEKDELLRIFTRATTIRIPLKIISSKYSDKFLKPKLVGIFDFDFATIDKNFIMIPISKMQKLANLRNKTQSLFIFLDNPNGVESIKQKVSEILENDTQYIVYDNPKDSELLTEFKDSIESETTWNPDNEEDAEKIAKIKAILKSKTSLPIDDIENIQNASVLPEINQLLATDELMLKPWNTSYWITYFEMARGIYFIIYMVFIIVASFLIVNTIIMVIHERMKEIGMMGALGMDRREIIGVFFLEAVFLSLIGACIGGIIGGGFTLLLSFQPISMEAMTGGIDFPMSNTIYIKFSFLNIGKGILYGLLISSICTILPSLKAAFIEPVEALRR